jgi:hypothetical protein
MLLKHSIRCSCESEMIHRSQDYDRITSKCQRTCLDEERENEEKIYTNEPIRKTEPYRT